MKYVPGYDAFRKFFEEQVEASVDPSKLNWPHARYYITVLVDDNCTICPIALRLLEATEKARGEELDITAINIDHAEAPLKPKATPAFCASLVPGDYKRCVYWEGIAIDGWEKLISLKLAKAYVYTHPRLPELLARITEYAKANGYVVVPDGKLRFKLLRELLENWDRYGKPYCPCRPERSDRTVCPCVYARADIAKMGHCLCGLFWSRQLAEKWIELQKKRYAKLIEEIDKVVKVLEEFKDAVILNEGDAADYVAQALMDLAAEIQSLSS